MSVWATLYGVNKQFLNLNALQRGVLLSYFMIDTKLSRIPSLWCFYVEDCWSCDKRNWLIHMLILTVLFWNWHISLNLIKTFHMNVSDQRLGHIILKRGLTWKGATWVNDNLAYYLPFDNSVYWMEFGSCH